MQNNKFKNPVIKGAYPDPSVCRAGDWFYLVASSFAYFPGLPVFKSRDLVHWEQVGNAISRPGQIDFRGCDTSEGLWAATIRFYNGRFYIVGLLDVNGRNDRYHFVITAENAEGPWSDAAMIEGAEGIDPSLYFDGEGGLWFCANRIPEKLLYPTHKQIYLCELDPRTFQFCGQRTIIYDAVVEHAEHMEAPHIYRIGEYYYLLTACGGTQTNHCVNAARSKNLLGPYEPCPRNPIVTNRSLPMLNSLGISTVGHGDLVQTQGGEWYMLMLGIRPYEAAVDDYTQYSPRKWIRLPDRNKKAQFNLGREVFLAPIAWDADDWPILDNANGLVNPEERRPALPYHRAPLHSRVDNFEEAELGMEWCTHRPNEPFYSLTQRPGFLRMQLRKATAESRRAPAMLLRRQQHNDFQAAAAMEFEPRAAGQEAGLVVWQNEFFHYLAVKRRLAEGTFVICYKVCSGRREEVARKLSPAGRLYLTVEGTPGTYSFYYGNAERERKVLAKDQDGTLLSTLVADGYVGAWIGMYASADADGAAGYADFDWFRYEIVEE